MSAVVKGTGQATQQVTRKRFTKGVGWEEILVFEGPTQASVYGLAPGMISAGFTQIDVFSPDGIKWRIEGAVARETEGVVEEPQNEWELAGSSESKDIRLHPYYQVISQANLNAIDSAISEHEAPTFVADVGDPSNTRATALYNLLRRGQTNYFYAQHVLQHTLTAASYNDITWAMSDDGYIFTFAQLPYSEITTAVVAALNTIPNVTAPTGYRWGWLKMPTTVRQNIFSSAQVHEEWRLDIWPTNVYSTL
jgi:hypothetical protein